MTKKNDYALLVGCRVADFRKAVDLNQTELAKRAGISQPTISRIERGEGTVDASVLLKLAIAIGVSVEALIGSSLMQNQIVAAGRPGSSSSSMEAMRHAALEYLADFRRVNGCVETGR